MTKIKTYVSRKHAGLSMIAKSSVLVEKGHLCNYFPNPLPPNFIIFHNIYDFVRDLANVWDMPVIFVFCRVFDVVDNM